MGLIFAPNRAMQQQRYLNEKAFYLSFASHEIVSPLTSVSWAIRYQRDQPDVLAKVEGAIGEILTTVNDVLSLQNLDRLSAKKLDKEPEQISALIDTLITNLSIVCTSTACGSKTKQPKATKPLLRKSTAYSLNAYSLIAYQRRQIFAQRRRSYSPGRASRHPVDRERP